MTKTIIVRAWDKDNPKVYFEYEIDQADYAESMIGLKLDAICKKNSSILDTDSQEST